MKKFKQFLVELAQSQFSELERLAKNVLQKATRKTNIEFKFKFARHGFDGVNDVKGRNKKEITHAHLIKIIKKGFPKLIKGLDEYLEHKVVIQDKKSDTNLIVTVEEDSDKTVHIIAVSAQNKPNYKPLYDQFLIIV